MSSFLPLREPATKVFACQISHLPKREGPRGYHVWIQGVIVRARVNEDNSSSGLVVDDGTGLVIVNGLEVVTTKPWFREGQYVMVAGHLSGNELSHSGEFVHSLVATKISDLSSEPLNEFLWLLEVMDIQTQLGRGDG